MTLPKNASRQVPDWRIGHRPHPEILPKRAADRQMERYLEEVWARGLMSIDNTRIDNVAEYFGTTSDLQYADEGIWGSD